MSVVLVQETNVMILVRGRKGRQEGFTYQGPVVVGTESVGDFVAVVGRPWYSRDGRMAHKYVWTVVGAGGASPVTLITLNIYKIYPTMADSNKSYGVE